MVKKSIPKNIILNLGTSGSGKMKGGSGRRGVIMTRQRNITYDNIDTRIAELKRQVEDTYTREIQVGEPQTEAIPSTEIYERHEGDMLNIRRDIIGLIDTTREKKILMRALGKVWGKLVNKARKEFITNGGDFVTSRRKYKYLQKLTPEEAAEGAEEEEEAEPAPQREQQAQERIRAAVQRGLLDSQSGEMDELFNLFNHDGSGLKMKGRGGGASAGEPREDTVVFNRYMTEIETNMRYYYELSETDMSREELVDGVTNLYQVLVNNLNSTFRRRALNRIDRDRLIEEIKNKQRQLSLNDIDYNFGLRPEDIETEIIEDEEGEGGGLKKKRRGRPKKKPEPKEVIIKEVLPSQKFSRKSNKALDQLLEANREKEKALLERSLIEAVRMRGAGDKDDDEFEEHYDWRTGQQVRERKPIERQPLKGLPQFGSTTLKIPPFFAVPTKKGWRLANPLTEIRNLANRQHKLSVNIKRSNVSKPEIDMSIPREIPTLQQFSAKDQAKLRAYMEAVKEGKEEDYLFKNKPRGFPAVLYKNAKKAGYKETNRKLYRQNTLKPKKVSKVPQGRQAKPRRFIIEGEDEEEEAQAGNEDEGRVEQQKRMRDIRKANKGKTAEEFLSNYDFDKFYDDIEKDRGSGGYASIVFDIKDKLIKESTGLSPAEKEKVKKVAEDVTAFAYKDNTRTDIRIDKKEKFKNTKENFKKYLFYKLEGKGLAGFHTNSVMEDECENDQDGGCDGEGYGGSLSVKDLKGLLGASYDPKQDKVNDFELDKEISASTSKVYVNKKTGQVVVAHMGTKGLLDWANNAVYAYGGEWAYKKTPRYKEAKKVQERAESKYGAKNVSTIGHSQAGLQSELLGKNSKEIITYNKATRPFGNSRSKSKNQYDIRTTGDIVSGLNPFQRKNKKEIVIKSKTSNPLTEHSREALEGLDEEQIIGEGLEENENFFSRYNNIMPSQGGRMLGLTRHAVLPAHAGHPALVSDQYPRIPQSFTQVHLAHPVPIGGRGLGGRMGSDSESNEERMEGGRTYAQRLAARTRRTFAPVERAAVKTFTPKLGRDITSTLIHKALPAVISGIAGSATTVATGNPALGFAVGQTAGKYAGKKAGDTLGKATGYGLGAGMKKPKLVKGSKEAKEYMASIRSKRMKGGNMPPRSRGIVTDPSLL